MPPWWAAIANYRTLRAEVDTPHKAAVAYRYFVLEITSKWTRREDEGKKKLYEDLGVREYWQFDPTGHYLEPILKGRELGPEGKYRDLELKERDGALCHASLLGLELRLEGRRLVYFDPVRNASLQTHTEERSARQSAQVARQRAEAARPGWRCSLP